MERSGPTPSALRRASLPERVAQDEHLLLLRNAAAAGLVLEHMYVLVFIGLFSSPFAADFGPCPEKAGRTAGRRYFVPLLSPPTSGLAQMGRRGRRRWTRSLLFYASRRQHRAWPGWGGGGVRCLGVEFALLSFTHWPLDGRPSYARSLVPTPPKTVDQTLPP